MAFGLTTDAGRAPVLVAIQKLATSLAQVLLKERNTLDLPWPGAPLDRGCAPDD